jgi:hypothetical protein
VVLACAAALSGSLILSAGAGAATIHACVKKTSGVTRIVGAKTKCKRSEQRLSWNTAGPKGAAGAPGPPGSPGTAGATGAAGAAGAVAGFVASELQVEPVEERPTVIVSKLLPPGSYVVSAKSELAASSKAAETAEVECGMFDAPGTTPPVTGSTLDLAIWAASTEKFGTGTEFEAVASLPFLASVSSSVATTVDLVCGRSKVLVSALYSQLSAIQVSSLG